MSVHVDKQHDFISPPIAARAASEQGVTLAASEVTCKQPTQRDALHAAKATLQTTTFLVARWVSSRRENMGHGNAQALRS